MVRWDEPQRRRRQRRHEREIGIEKTNVAAETGRTDQAFVETAGDRICAGELVPAGSRPGDVHNLRPRVGVEQPCDGGGKIVEVGWGVKGVDKAVDRATRL